MAYFILDTCTSCGHCLEECPTNSIVEGEKKYLIDSDSCDDHRACVAVCPVSAIVPIKDRDKKIEPGQQRARPGSGE